MVNLLFCLINIGKFFWLFTMESTKLRLNSWLNAVLENWLCSEMLCIHCSYKWKILTQIGGKTSIYLHENWAKKSAGHISHWVTKTCRYQHLQYKKTHIGPSLLNIHIICIFSNGIVLCRLWSELKDRVSAWHALRDFR